MFLVNQGAVGERDRLEQVSRDNFKDKPLCDKSSEYKKNKA